MCTCVCIRSWSRKPDRVKHYYILCMMYIYLYAHTHTHTHIKLPSTRPCPIPTGLYLINYFPSSVLSFYFPFLYLLLFYFIFFHIYQLISKSIIFFFLFYIMINWQLTEQKIVLNFVSVYIFIQVIIIY